MAQNLVIPNKDNKVVFVFGGIDLLLATDIQVQFGAESYTLLLNPTIVSVDSSTELSLDLSATSEVGKIFATVTYFDGASVNGTDITSRELGNSDKIVVAIGSQLIIEDGSIVVNANSFVTDDEFKAYTDLSNYDVPATQPDREALLFQAWNFINSSYEQRLQGYRVNAEQAGIFPRNNVYAYSQLVANDTIPSAVKIAQMQAALSINDGANTNAFKSDADLSGFKVVGVYEETYQSGSSTPTLPEMPAVSRTMGEYLKSSNMSLSRENMGYLG